MAAETNKPHVLIVGAGIGGLFLAQFLRKKGISFDVYELDSGPSDRVPGWPTGLCLAHDYNSHMPQDVAAIRSVCHLLPLKLPSQFITYPPGGKVRVGVEDTPETPCVRADRGKLRDLLLTAVPVHWGKKAVGLQEDSRAGKVTVSFADGTTATGDVVVGADGLWSTIRELVLRKSNAEVVEPVPMAMIHGETVLRGAAFEKHLRLAYSGYIAIHPGMVFFCGLDHVSADGAAGSFYWYLYMRDKDTASPDHWLHTATCEAKYAHVLERTASVLDPKFTEIVRIGGPEAISEPFSLYYDAHIASAPRTYSRVVFIGDAAHPTTPFRGEGDAMALQDALQLSGVLAAASVDDSTLPAALESFQKEVLERGSEMVQLSRNVVNGVPPKGVPHSWGYPVKPMPEPTGPLGIAADI